ncbi:MAG: UvrD-helicase domain-containing protein [Trueperaceae bacterium]
MIKTLNDAEARRRALTEREKSLLVEAGAGSGKTALMAGRVVLLLADGVEPRNIAAITFTELAAAELAHRIRLLAQSLLDGDIPIELAIALPDGLSEQQLESLTDGFARLDELTSATIHGFALDLVRPYPVEAGIDPGARPMDEAEKQLLFDDVFDGWLRERLSRPDDASDLVAQLVLADDGKRVVDNLGQIAEKIPDYPEAHGGAEASLPEVSSTFENFSQEVAEFGRTVRAHPFQAQGAADQLQALERFVEHLGRQSQRPLRLAVEALHHRPDPPFVKNGTHLRKNAGSQSAWKDAASEVGASMADALRACDECADAYTRACEAFEELEGVSCRAVHPRLVDTVREVLAAYAKRKRDAALLDFDDMLSSAVRLLCEHPEVRDALSERYLHILVDEFQDTDPRQAEIVWRLTGQPLPGSHWTEWPTRGCSRFVVGDPKQSIYRFRRADVDTYLELRERMRRDPDADEVNITTNFRSLPGILEVTNVVFEVPLSEPGQPGYTPLDPHRKDSGLPAVARLQLPLTEGGDSSNALKSDDARDVEAEAVANFCARLISGDPELPISPVEPEEIALLAPTGTQLWRYEQELERLGIAVASQAGKGFYQRQEIQDLVALTRALADTSDTLALGALLRGPLVGATEEQLLDVAEELNEAGERPLSLWTEPELLPEGVIKRAIGRLRPLAMRARSRTPYSTLSAALEQLEVRALVLQRHGGKAERALANVERFLESARPWSVRGLRAFAQDVFDKWSESERSQEGRPEAEEGSVTLITVHSAKGLEWKVVIPINMLGKPDSLKPPFVDRSDNRLWCKIGQVVLVPGYEEARDREKAASQAERIRLLYVAATRACDLLVVPKPEWKVEPNSWLTLAGLHQVEGPTIPMVGAEPLPTEQVPDGAQGAQTFLEEAERIRQVTPSIEWRRPSRHEAVDGSAAGPIVDPEFGDELVQDIDLPELTDESIESSFAVEGRGAVRGLILHALMEALITGEVQEGELEEHSARLTDVLFSTAGEGTVRPDPQEMAGAARRAWNLPEVLAVREDLVAELNVYGSSRLHNGHQLVSGIADAVALNINGEPYQVIDWKSDVNPKESTIASYREQVSDYLRLANLERGLIVFATTGSVVVVISSATGHE